MIDDPSRFVRKAPTIDERSFGRTEGKMSAPEAIFEKDGKFFFWDETWANSQGPFDTREAAQEGMRKYAESLG